MGKAERNRQQNARQRIAMQQAAARRAEAQRRMFIVGGSTLLVIVIVVGLVIAKSLDKTTTPAAATTTTAKTNTAVAAEVTSVPVAVLNKVGAGPSGSAAVEPLKTISSSPLTLNGKPEVLFMGEESCPYCGAERWALTVALSRFGTFSNLHFIHSSPTDVYASTPTLTYYKSSYTSNYISFHPVEEYTVSGQPLQEPTSAEAALFSKFGGNGFPFADVDGKYVVEGPQYLPSVLGTVYGPGDISKSALTWAQIGSDLQDPSSPVAQAIIGSANHITAAICKVTNDQPSAVCDSTSVTSIGSDI
jgi:hypothetical protein